MNNANEKDEVKMDNLTLEFNNETYSFSPPVVRSYLEDGISVSFVDGKTIYCDDVSGEGGDTCVWWSGSRGGPLVGPQEKVYTKQDYIDYCCELWLNMVENKLERAEFYRAYKETGQ